MGTITCLGEDFGIQNQITLESRETCAKFYRAWTPSFWRGNHTLKIGLGRKHVLINSLWIT